MPYSMDSSTRIRAETSRPRVFGTFWLGWGHVRLLVVLSLAGLTCLWVESPAWVVKAYPGLDTANLGLAAAVLLWGVVVAHLVVHFAVTRLRGLYGLDPAVDHCDLWPPIVTGMLESAIFPVAFLSDRPEVVGAWVVLKASGQWSRWSEPESGRSRFQVLLAGTALSGVAGLIVAGLMRSFAGV